MPKHSRNDKSINTRQKRFTDNLGDITLNDFANVSGNGSRLRKPASHAIVREVKDFCGPTNDINWYDKDIESFDIQNDLTLENDDDNRVALYKSTKSKSKKNVLEDTSIDKNTGNEYPLDVWFLLSEYIRPEDVKTFACICRSALQALNSPRFWLRLYKRYYNPSIQLPQRLTPECMERPRGLKACVIRTLFYTYPPLIERIKKPIPFEDELHFLVPSYCNLAWHKKHQKAWHFNFKFQRSKNQYKGPTKPSKHPDLLEMLNDVDANEEQGCKVLQIVSMNFVSAPAVMGMYLTSVVLNVGYKMHHRLRLTFSNTTYGNTANNHNEGNVTIIFDPVSNVKVLNWWHPQYPYI